jgi:UDP-N-acetylmuramate dehydrogenase
MSLLHYNIALSEYTTWRVGGPAKCLYQPDNIEDLNYFLRSLPPEEKIFWLGLGSNLLIRDTGFEGTVLLMRGTLNKMSWVKDTIVRIEAGAPCGSAARFCARLGLTGIEFLAGVPGTMGGALAMNAGAHGGETWQFVSQCETIDRQGNMRLRSASDYQPAYRHVHRPPGEWFTAVYLRLVPGKKENSLEKINALLAHRTATQPINFPNCGSVFRNPPNDYAARLIEACGLKGCRIGGASVSVKHANFIINDQNATASDIEQLINHVQQRVKDNFNIALIREVHVMGE